MNNRQRNIIIAAVVFVAILIIFLQVLSSGKQKYLDWTDSYEPTSKHPYGTHVLYQLLKSHSTFVQIKTPLATALPIEEGNNFVFIGDYFGAAKDGISQLLDFVEVGNNAFILAHGFTPALAFKLYPNEAACDTKFIWNGSLDNLQDSIITLQTTDSKPFSCSYVYNHYSSFYSWHFFKREFFCEKNQNFIQLGTTDGRFPNFVKVPYGTGAFYLHTTPLAFTNYYLRQTDGLAYAESVFSYLNPDGTIYWDASHAFSEDSDSEVRSFESVSLSEKNPLEYILSQPAFRWAWYLLLATAALYLLFGAKRRQAIIPIIETKTNNSLDFVRAISRLYFQQNNHFKLAQQEMKLFLSFLHDRYPSFTFTKEQASYEKLASISGVPLSKIEKIFQLHQSMERNIETSPEQLIELHQNFEFFYKNCK